MKMRF